MGYLKYVRELNKSLKKKAKSKENPVLSELVTERKLKWRRGPSIVRVERPTNIASARSFGYKAKQGIVTCRVRIHRGGARKSRPNKGRRPKRAGMVRIYYGKSLQRVAEERANRRYINLEVLGSYWVWEDGKYKWFEVVLVDTAHPSIKVDKDLGWMSLPQHKNRASRGLTPAGTKGRGQTKKGIGAEKVRPSIRAKNRRGK